MYRDGTIWRFNTIKNQWGNKNTWILAIQNLTTTGCFRINIRKKQYKCHRIIAFAYLGLDIDDKTQIIDHKNRIPTDNRLENLHIVTHQQNMWNTGAKGYCFDKRRNKYVAYIMVNRKQIFLGYFDTEEEAATAYQNAKLVHHAL